MISIRSNIKQFEREWRGRVADLQKVTARTLTGLARQANGLQARNIMDGRMTIRAPQFALKSLRVYPAGETRPIARQDAMVGTFSKYLPVTDQGGKVRPKSGRARLVPTQEARGGDDTRPVLRGFRIPRIMPVTRRGQKGRPGGAFVIVRHGAPAVYIRRGRKAKSLIKVRHLSKGPSKVPAFHWHQSAIRKVWQQANLDRTFRAVADRVMRGNT